MPISFIDPEYLSNIIFAVHRYQILKPNTRLDDVEQCLAIARADHRSHRILYCALKKYLDEMQTGFHLLGIKSFPIRTGSSILRTFILQALDSKPEHALLAYEIAAQARIRSTDSDSSQDELIAQHTELLSKLERMRNAHERLKIEDKMTRSDNEKLQKKLIDRTRHADELAVKNMELEHALLELTEGKNALAEINKRLYKALQDKGLAAGASSNSKTRLASTLF